MIQALIFFIRPSIFVCCDQELRIGDVEDDLGRSYSFCKDEGAAAAAAFFCRFP